MCRTFTVFDDTRKPLELSNFFVPILKDFTINEYTVKDSFSFAEEIVEQDAKLFMVLFDIESLFTNIP